MKKLLPFHDAINVFTVYRKRVYHASFGRQEFL